MSHTARRIVANLDCEARWVGSELPEPVLKKISALGTLMRVFARDGDALWTPHAVDPSRMAPVNLLATPVLESGPLDALSPAAETLWWCTPSDASMRANHRSFCFSIAEELNCVLPGARFVSSVEELYQHLRAGGAAAAPGAKWVLKSPLSAASRDRVVWRGLDLDEPSKRRTERLLSVHGSLLFEPWMDRTLDLGSLGEVTDSEIRLLGGHRLVFSESGALSAIEIPPPGGESLWMRAEERALLNKTTLQVGEKLRAAGILGPFGIDAWFYRDLAGVERLHPLGEINARLTLGRLAREIAERSGMRKPGASVRMGFSVGKECAQPPHAVPLLLPSATDTTAAWMER